MAIDPKSNDSAAVRRLTPFNTMPGGYFEALCNKMTVHNAKSGAILFSKGEPSTDLFYLLEGEVALQSDEFDVEKVSASNPASRFALAHQVPRKINAVAKNDIRYIRVTAELIKQPPAEYYEGESSFMITDENEGDWMTELLKSPVFQRLPAANLQKIIMGFQTVSFAEGELVVTQDEPADYYFIIKSGQCVLTRKPSPSAKAIALAKLGVNDSFGEEALISGNPRNVSVTALTEMEVLRMNKENFNILIKEAVLDFVSFEDLQRQLDEHTLIMDVRPPDAYKHQHLENSVNVPLFSLRMQLKTLNRKQKIFVVCQDGRESSTAAFLLIKNRFDAVVLEEGLNAVPGMEVIEPPVLELDDVQEVQVEQLQEISEQEHNINSEPDPVMAEDEKALEVEELKQKNKELTANYSRLLEEKEQLEKDYRILLKQNEKLKAVLGKLTDVN